jgi:single-stranded DNA-binding protein
MPIKTSTSMSGFIATTPALSQTEDGTSRAYIRAGQEHYLRNEDGTFAQTESTFHDLVLFRATADRAAEQFKKGDRFVAEGYIDTFDAPDKDGVMQQRETFVARKIGHDTLHTRYQVDRTPRVQQGPTNTCDLQPAPASGEPVAVGM